MTLGGKKENVGGNKSILCRQKLRYTWVANKDGIHIQLPWLVVLCSFYYSTFLYNIFHLSNFFFVVVDVVLVLNDSLLKCKDHALGILIFTIVSNT